MNLEKINYLLNYYAQLGIYHLGSNVEQFWWVFGIIGGWCLVSGTLIKQQLIGSLFLLIGILSLLAQVGLFFALPHLSDFTNHTVYRLSIKHLYAYSIGALFSGIAAFIVFRRTIGWFEQLKEHFVKSSSLEREGNTDIRKLEHILPKAKSAYDVTKYFKKNKVFIGLNARRKPTYIPIDKWRSSHIDLIGTTGSGKGVAAGVLLTQAALMGEAVIVLDPKEDEYLPHVLGQVAEKAGLPFYHIDLTSDTPQWNPLSNRNSVQIEELLGAAFGLSEKGTDADFYRLNDRKAARFFASTITNASFPKQVQQFFADNSEVLENAPKFKDDLEEIASLPVVNCETGLNIDKAIEQGAVIYVCGSMRNTRILKLQKMFVLAVMQSCENRERDNARHVCLFLDEFKYLISRPALEALGAIRDKRAHLMLAHQSLGDLRDCPNDINPDSVLASINENCALKLTYKVNDPDTADWLARMSGKIQVDQEIRHVGIKSGLTEQKSTDRSLKQAERYLIDTNM